MEFKAASQCAIAKVVLFPPHGERFETLIACEQFNVCELAQKVASQFPGHTPIRVNWVR